ncbi:MULTISPECIES: efflux RND transporter periplasmic adaptor subunit [unclassified Herbaspirillum]|uniref:efflux RND transporter periplasmic adaptor subunit n=1 Tax=unclassified Herbaspirillum TaxID=2624150 RepID=UPI000E2F66B7|nr:MULTISPECIES: efflux RND transporter periplasmic adaptor subunit [unclassified Herbaspirillum]RFB65756.1 efflux RND transporter periplasmic adaptor subunit [Herbaspirillum sp. 3R-3a1]TFI08939.1 efflux RND transporter periplasmic adaptor subunit [Herbaspirillum sp. 3R11]TFI15357.1 efflux RND transporter periplasmic adaptor subunit [Herbaspirillum sp. 3R-11]TFI19704.1 efflux RND transporter periplasmic adaptor subunit [Herbaspirillum sp. 3C11]
MTKKQKLTIAAIAAVTALLAALILLSGASKSAPADAHAESGHDHAAEKTTKDDHKEDGHKEAKDDHDDDKDHKDHDEKGHNEKGHDEKGHDEDSKIAFSEQQLKTAGIVLDTAAPGRIRTSLQLPGEIRFNQDRTAHVVPKVNGVVESVSANLGQQVKKGQVLAVVSSSAVSEQRSELLNAQQRLTLAQSTHAREKTLWQEKISAEQDYLQAGQALKEAEIAVRNAQQKLAAIGAGTSSSGLNRYEIRAPFDGIVVEKHLALGEAVKEDASIFTISDLSSVWAEMTVAARDMNAVRVGESVTVNATAFASSASGKIAYVGALLGEQTRTAKAHVVLPNPGNVWRPGLFVNVDVLAQEAEVPLAVAADAVQSVEQKQVVFVRVADGFRKQEVTLGRTDGKRVEIIKGLSAGDVYAAAGSFVIKAELGKGSAEHAH